MNRPRPHQKLSGGPSDLWLLSDKPKERPPLIQDRFIEDKENNNEELPRRLEDINNLTERSNRHRCSPSQQLQVPRPMGRHGTQMTFGGSYQRDHSNVSLDLEELKLSAASSMCPSFRNQALELVQDATDQTELANGDYRT